MVKLRFLLFTSSLLLTIVITGCQSDHPTDSTMLNNSSDDNVNPGTPPNNEITYLKMPKPLIGGNRSVIVQKLVTPFDTTKFNAAASYTSLNGNLVTVSVVYKIPSGAVSDSVIVTMEIDTVLVGVKFKPEGLQFAVPTTMDVTVLGLDPFMIGSLAFVYVKTDGTFEKVQFSAMKVTGNLGKIVLQKGLLRHFSQYSFGRLTAEENDK